jgi:hypothetical protein
MKKIRAEKEISDTGKDKYSYKIIQELQLELCSFRNSMNNRSDDYPGEYDIQWIYLILRAIEIYRHKREEPFKYNCEENNGVDSAPRIKYRQHESKKRSKNEDRQIITDYEIREDKKRNRRDYENSSGDFDEIIMIFQIVYWLHFGLI